jgi:hypothetical protein
MEPPPELTEAQSNLLDWLDRHGAVSPSQVLAQTELAPREAWDTIQELAQLNLVVIRQDPDSPDGSLVVPVPRYSNIAQQNAPSTKPMRLPGRSPRAER